MLSCWSGSRVGWATVLPTILSADPLSLQHVLQPCRVGNSLPTIFLSFHHVLQWWAKRPATLKLRRTTCPPYPSLFQCFPSQEVVVFVFEVEQVGQACVSWVLAGEVGA
jgi:hypothetical protein